MKKFILLCLIICGAISTVHAADPTINQALDDSLSWSTNNEWWIPENDPNSLDGVDTVKYTVTYPGDEGIISTKVTGPGTLTFYWRKTTQINFQFLAKRSEGGTITLNYENNHPLVSMHLGSGHYALSWRAWNASDFTMYGIANLDKVIWKADDITAPKVISTIPKNNSKRISRTSDIYIKFSENIKSSTNWSKIMVKKNGKIVPISKRISGKYIILHTNKRSSNTYYTVYIPSVSVKDASENKLAKKYVFKFKTK